MPFSDSNRVGLKFIKETTWGVTPSGPNMQALNFTSESLKSNNNTVTSETIRDDRNISDLTIVGGGAGGDAGFELRYDDVDVLIAGALNSTWTTTVMSSATCSAGFTTGGKVVCDSSAAVNVVAGQFLRVKSATTDANDGDYRISVVSTTGENTTLTCTIPSSGAAASFTTEVFATATTMAGKSIRNGTTKQSFSIEKSFGDIGVFHNYQGM
ncbi:MAG: hypothetical protein GY938_05130, partial [Ketobacter sp.]|nr:hypothetical protein [Ketobacter sp.]